MSSERKLREKLTKNLNGKKIAPKAERAANTSEFFKEIQNKEKPNKTSKAKSQEHLPELELNNEQKSAAKRPQRLKSNKTHPNVIETAIKCISQESEIINELKAELEMKTKSHQSSRNRVKNKVQETKSDEPSTSKRVKKELSGNQWQPPNWEAVLDNIRKMRSEDKAPVDTMGCHECADEKADDKTRRFHKLIALMLSSQTKDETTYNAMLRLKENNLTPDSMCNIKISVLENILHPVSFYKNKAKYIQQTSKILIDKYNSDIPNNIKDLVALPGVGPKMAHICMAVAWNEITGIGVDVHVHRISNRIGWLPKLTKEPEQTRKSLETWLPKHLWSEVNHLLVGFGQTICTPIKPKCIDCLNFSICPSAVSRKK